jgi:hypothetical protein
MGVLEKIYPTSKDFALYEDFDGTRSFLKTFKSYGYRTAAIWLFGERYSRWSCLGKVEEGQGYLDNDRW